MPEGIHEAPGAPGGLSPARLAELNVRPDEWSWFKRIATHEQQPMGSRSAGARAPFWEEFGAILIAFAGFVAMLLGIYVAAWLCAGYVTVWCLLRFRMPGSRRARLSEHAAQVGRSYGGGNVSRDARDAVDLLLHIPGTCIFHDVRFPGVEGMRAQHVVVNGARVFLLDSSLTESGVYHWGNPAIEAVVSSSGGVVHWGHLHVAVAGFAALLRVPSVYGASMLMGAGSSVEGPVVCERLLLGSVHDVLGWVGDFLVGDGDDSMVVDSARLRGVLYDNLV